MGKIKRNLSVILLIAALVAAAAALFACGAASGKLASIQREGKLVVYTDPNFYPFEFPGTEGIEGVDVE
ncbi:MAG: hypothetical protein LBU58_01310, partial [Clostridiales bacterium]|nr:hypothetical protein [Clostridiales bacterium]